MALKSDLTSIDALLCVGLDAYRYSKRDFTSTGTLITFIIPEDKSLRTVPVYIHEDHPLNIQAHFDLVGLKPYTFVLLGASFRSNICPKTQAERLHRYSHALPAPLDS